MDTLRVAIIGAGAISQQWHIPIIAGHERLSLLALVDLDSELINELAGRYEVPLKSTDYTTLPLGDIDIAVVATPSAFHFPVATFFLERGIHVLVEKPLATRLEDAKALVDLAQENNVVLSCGLYRRLYPSLAVLKQFLEEGDFGRVKSSDIHKCKHLL